MVIRALWKIIKKCLLKTDLRVDRMLFNYSANDSSKIIKSSSSNRICLKILVQDNRIILYLFLSRSINISVTPPPKKIDGHPISEGHPYYKATFRDIFSKIASGSTNQIRRPAAFSSESWGSSPRLLVKILLKRCSARAEISQIAKILYDILEWKSEFII